MTTATKTKETTLRPRPVPQHAPPPHLLVKWRERCDLTQQEAADLCGLSHHSWWHFEQGRKTPQAGTTVTVLWLRLLEAGIEAE